MKRRFHPQLINEKKVKININSQIIGRIIYMLIKKMLVLYANMPIFPMNKYSCYLASLIVFDKNLALAAFLFLRFQKSISLPITNLGGS